MIKTLLSQVKEYKLPSFLTPAFMIGEVICEMIIPILMGRIVDLGIQGNDMNYILRTGAIMLIVAIIGLFFGVLGGFTGSKASAGFAKNLRKEMFKNIQTFSFANIDNFSSSSLVTRLTTDVTNIQMAYMMILRMAMRAPASMIIAMVMSFLISPRLASIYLVAVILIGLVLSFIMVRTTAYFKKVFEKYDLLNESVQENVSAIRVVKAYVREDTEISKFKKAAFNIYLLFVKAELKIAKIVPLMMTTVYVCILLISWFGANMIVSQSLTTGELMSLLTYCMNILMSLMFLSIIFVMLTMSEASAKRIVEVITEVPTITNPSNAISKIDDGSIEFENVDFAYSKDAKEMVLSNINLKINSGETIGIIGGTGSAKSSLVNLISRLYDVSQGQVKVGGHNVKDYDIKSLRDQVSVVLQKNVLFSGSIIENLRWGNKNASLEDCKKACDIACATEFIEKMPDGFDTHIEQGGSNVSGGQKQRLCIARAILKKPKILIFDDSTSAVDTSTDAKIRNALASEIPSTTKIIIAQRISSVEHCDKVIVMDDGKVVGFDTPSNLLITNSIYREVYESQNSSSSEADFDEIN